MKTKMTALRPHFYAGRTLKAGEIYDAFDEHVFLLETVKASRRYVEEAADRAAEESATGLVSPKTKRQYHRRDLTAESD
jgi:hypothetical protein